MSCRPIRSSTLLSAFALTSLVATSSYAVAAEPIPSERVAEAVPTAIEPAASSLRDRLMESPRSLTQLGATASPQRALDRGRLQQSIDELVADGAVGVVARVDSANGTWSGASGARDREEQGAAKRFDAFRAASNTKMMVATLVMQEVEAGRISLDTNINDVVPEIFPGRAVTIKQLLSHRSGAPDALGEMVGLRMQGQTWADFFDAIGYSYSDEEFLDVANALEWTEPDQQWSYSNAAYVALGVMVERLNGSDLGTLLRERVFRPAGMHNTSYPLAPGFGPRFLTGAASTSQGWYSTANFNPSAFSAAGAGVTTTADLNKFTEALMSGELVSAAMVKQMMTPLSDTPIDYGLGLMRLPDPCSIPERPSYLYGHNGGAFGTVSWSLTSGDGSRQISIGLTGRYYDDVDPLALPPYDLDGALVELIAATC